MDHDAFRAAWLEAQRAADLLTYPDLPEDLLDLRTMARKHSLRVGLGRKQMAEPFFVTMLLGWRWTPLDSARTFTNEEDLLSELLGREQARGVVTEQPWVRVDVDLHATLPWGQPLRLRGTEIMRRWIAEVPGALPMLRTKVERSARGVEAVHACLGEPEAHVRCGPSGDLLLLSVELKSWRAVRLSRASELEDVQLEGETMPELEQLAADARAALEAWTRSLQLLLPPGR